MMIKKRIKLLLIFPLIQIIFLQASFAQLVNIEKQRKNIKNGLQGSIDFSLNSIQNSKNITQFSNDISIQYTHNHNTILILNDITLLRIKDNLEHYDLINKNFQHIRYNYTFKKPACLTYEFFVQNQQNKIRFINERFLVGTGLRIRMLKTTSLTFYIAPLAMFEYEQLSDSLKNFSRMIKGDFYVSGNVKIADRISLSHVTYYQPALANLGGTIKLEQFKDFRLYSETNLAFTIIKNFLEYSLDLMLSYDSRPPVELKNHPLFYTIENKLTIKI